MIVLSVHNSADIYGASQSLTQLVCGLAEQGHTVHVVLPAEGPLSRRLRSAGVVVWIYPPLAILERINLTSPGSKSIFPLRVLQSTVWMAFLILRLRVDVVHSNTAVLPSPGLAALLTRRKHIWHIREFFSDFPSLWRLYQKYIWHLSTSIVTISDAVRDQFDPRYRDRCTTIYNGLAPAASTVNQDRVREFRGRIGNPRIAVGVVGRIKWIRKGQEVVVKAAALLAQQFPDVKYVIVGTAATGNEDHLERLHELVRLSNLEDRFIFTGDLDNLPDIYAALDITVVPSVMPEPFGRVAMESMAVGTPVIGSRCGGIPEQVIDGVTGLLFTPGDEFALATALETLISNRPLRVEMGKNASKRASTVFSHEVAAKEYVRLFTSVAARTLGTENVNVAVDIEKADTAEVP